jgi:endoribonuclease LACTB2
VFLLEDIAPGVQMIRARGGKRRAANTYVLGDRELLLVEPICLDNRIEGPAWVQLFEQWKRQERRVRGILLTHFHADHCYGVRELAQTLRVPLFAPPLVDPILGCWDVLHTPGHAAEHVSLWDGGILVCGDMISTDGPVLLPPVSHGGDLSVYTAQCARLAALDARLALPAHGDPIWNPRAAFEIAAGRFE